MKLLFFFVSTVFLCAHIVSLHGRQCLHWQYDWNKHIKPRWALLSKQSLRSSGWHGHSKYSQSTSATVLKAQLCVICLSFRPLCAICIADTDSIEVEVELNIVNLKFLIFVCFFNLCSYGGRLSSVASSCICFQRLVVLEPEDIDLVIYAVVCVCINHCDLLRWRFFLQESPNNHYL